MTSLELSSGEWHQWQATWNGGNKWTAQHVGPKIKQIELWTCRNQYLSPVIFHFSVHESSEVCIGIALCLAIRNKYKWHHREKYSHEISILIMQTQDNVKVLMKFPSVLTFSNTTWQAWLWEGMEWFLRREYTQSKQSCQTLGQFIPTMCLIRMTQGVISAKCLP